MDNKFLVEKKNLLKAEENSYYTIKYLNDFLKNYEKCFRRKESIEALQKIKQYLIKEKEDYKEYKAKIEKNEKNIRENCFHEVLIIVDKILICPICKKRFKDSDIDFDCIIIEGDNISNRYLFEYIRNIIYEICKQNENISETFENYIDEEHIRIYRRLK